MVTLYIKRKARQGEETHTENKVKQLNIQLPYSSTKSLIINYTDRNENQIISIMNESVRMSLVWFTLNWTAQQKPKNKHW